MDSSTIQHIKDTFGILNARDLEYAVLRNFEGLPDANPSRDCDIIITRSSYRLALPRLLEKWRHSGWSIITYLNSDRLISFVTGRLAPSGSLSIMQWDFFFDTSVWGVELMSAEEFLRDRSFNGFLYHVGPVSRFLDKYLYNRSVGAAYPAKYAATRAEAERLPEVEAKLRRIFGCASVADCDGVKGRKLFFRALGRNLCRRPLALMRDMARFAWTFAANYFRSSTGFSIGFTGPDGSGKTTVIGGFLEATGDVFASAHAYMHFRPSLFGNLGEVAHSAGLKKSVDRNYDRPHRGTPTSALSSLARLAYYSADYVAGYFLKVKPLTRITRLVVFDRYYTDIICDSRRSRIYLPQWLLRAWGTVFIPGLDYNILLTADTDRILSRKTELDATGIGSINRALDSLSLRPGYYLVRNDGTPQEAVAAIWRIVLDRQNTRNLRRLGR